MSLFKNETHQAIWIEHHCDRCYFGQADTMCPILHRALRSDRKPVEWERNPRKGALMADTIKCKTKTAGPPPIPHAFVDLTESMFPDIETPVQMDGDHA